MDPIKAEIKIEDELNLSQDKTIAKQLEADEKVLYSSKISKHNKRGVVQQRIILVTTNYIYNIAYEGFFVKVIRTVGSRSGIKRKIPIDLVSAFTVSCDPNSSEFVIHVEKQHDYRYSGGEKKRENAIYAICMAFRMMTGRKIPFHFKEEADLRAYQTHDTDVKKNINKRPADAAYPISDQEMSLGLEFFIKGRKDLTKNDEIVRKSISIMAHEIGDFKPFKENEKGDDRSPRKSPENSKINLEEDSKSVQCQPYNESGVDYQTIPVTTSVMIKK